LFIEQKIITKYWVAICISKGRILWSYYYVYRWACCISFYFFYFFSI